MMAYQAAALVHATLAISTLRVRVNARGLLETPVIRTVHATTVFQVRGRVAAILDSLAWTAQALARARRRRSVAIMAHVMMG